MSWSEAYWRAIEAAVSVVVISIIGGVVVGFGGRIVIDEVFYSTFEISVERVAVGLLIALVGLAGIILGVLAAAIKTITDAVIDTMEKRDLSDTGGDGH